jgi:hypothetical protein
MGKVPDLTAYGGPYAIALATRGHCWNCVAAGTFTYTLESFHEQVDDAPLSTAID